MSGGWLNIDRNGKVEGQCAFEEGKIKCCMSACK
jgi:hypothetical protein